MQVVEPILSFSQLQKQVSDVHLFQVCSVTKTTTKNSFYAGEAHFVRKVITPTVKIKVYFYQWCDIIKRE